MKIILLALLTALVLTGCATTPNIDWAARVGNYTYDQAVLELGPPDKSAKLNDGIIVANWLTRQGYAYSSSGAPVYGYYSRGPLMPTYTQSYAPSFYLRLTFAADGKLTAWKKYAQ